MTEAVRPDGEMFGPERLSQLLVRERGAGVKESLSAPMAALDAWNGGHAKDDISVLAVEFQGSA